MWDSPFTYDSIYIGKTYRFHKIISFFKYINKFYSECTYKKGGTIVATLTVSKDEEKRLKGMGFLSNKGTDNFSARVITVNGKVTAAQQGRVKGQHRFAGGQIVVQLFDFLL